MLFPTRSDDATAGGTPDGRDKSRPYVAVAASEGLFGGDAEGRLKPQDGITRAQFCLVVYRAEQNSGGWVQGVRCSSEHEDKTRVVFDLSRAPGKCV